MPKALSHSRSRREGRRGQWRALYTGLNVWPLQSRHRLPHEAILQDFGARDPFPEEVASDFGNKTLGNYDTMHNIRCNSPVLLGAYRH